MSGNKTIYIFTESYYDGENEKLELKEPIIYENEKNAQEEFAMRMHDYKFYESLHTDTETYPYSAEFEYFNEGCMRYHYGSLRLDKVEI